MNTWVVSCDNTAIWLPDYHICTHMAWNIGSKWKKHRAAEMCIWTPQDDRTRMNSNHTLTTAQEGKTSSEQTLHSSAKPSFLPDQLAHRDRPRWYESLMSGGGHRKWGHAPYWTVNIAGRSGVTGFLCDDRVLATHTHTIRRARFHSCPK